MSWPARRGDELPEKEGAPQREGLAELGPHLRGLDRPSGRSSDARDLLHADRAGLGASEDQGGRAAVPSQGRRLDGAAPSPQARTTKDLDTVFRGRFEEWLDALDDVLSASVEGFSFSRTEPAEIRETHTFRVSVAIDLKGRRWGQVVLEVAPAEAAEVIDIDAVEPFDIGQFGLPAPESVPVVGLPYLIAQKLHACTQPPEEGDRGDRRRRLRRQEAALFRFGVGGIADVPATDSPGRRLGESDRVQGADRDAEGFARTRDAVQRHRVGACFERFRRQPAQGPRRCRDRAGRHGEDRDERDQATEKPRARPSLPPVLLVGIHAPRSYQTRDGAWPTRRSGGRGF